MLFFGVTRIYSQDSIIEFDRPGAADLPYLVPLRTIQIEGGYGLSVDDSGNMGFDNSPSFLIRFSTSKIFEMRVAINYLPMNTHFLRYYSANNIYGFGLGGKIKVCNEKNARPELAITGLVTFSDQSFRTDNPEPFGGEINILANNFITNWFYINYNAGYLYGGPKLESSFSYSTCFGFIMHKYVELFWEHFGYIHSADFPDWGIDGGICIFPTPRLQIDLSYVRLFNSIGNQNTVNIGVSYNIGFHKDHLKNLYWKN